MRKKLNNYKTKLEEKKYVNFRRKGVYEYLILQTNFCIDYELKVHQDRPLCSVVSWIRKKFNIINKDDYKVLIWFCINILQIPVYKLPWLSCQQLIDRYGMRYPVGK